jgi:hypothetical protein
MKTGSRTERAVGFVARNSNSILAISSLLIAGMSLYLTIQAQDDDRTYKELLIRPSLALRAHTVDWSIAIANDGLGPAQIKDIIYQIGGDCISMIDPDGELSRTNYYKVENALRTRFITDIFSFQIPSTSPAALTTRGQVLLPGTIIAVGKEIVLFRIDDTSLETLKSKLNALEMNFHQSLLEKFSALALTLPISIKFCSMSEKYCKIVEPEGDNGKHCRFRP